MPSFSKQLLSGSVDGKCIQVVATTTPGTLLHTAVAGAGAIDNVYIFVANVTGAAVLLTLEWGGAGNPADHAVHQLSIPANSSQVPIMVGQPMRNGLAIQAFASAANALNVTGWVDRIS